LPSGSWTRANLPASEFHSRRNGNTGCLKPGDHPVKLVDTEVHHETLVKVPEIGGVLGKRREDGRPGRLLPDVRRLPDPEHRTIPIGQRAGIPSTEEDAADADDFAAQGRKPTALARPSKRNKRLAGFILA
jgi:hypothetical protein